MVTSQRNAGSRRIKVCHIAATTEGATWMLEQLRELRDRYGYDVSAIISSGNGGLVEKLKQENIRFHQVDFTFIVSIRGVVGLSRRILALVQLLLRERYDIVQTHLFDSMIMGRLTGWLTDVPVRLSMIAGPYHLESATPQWIDTACAWMDTALIPSCHYTADLYRRLGVPEDRLHVIYYGPDKKKFSPESTAPANLREEYGLPPDTPLVGMVAYFYPVLPRGVWTPTFLHDRANKRHEDLVAAAPQIFEAFPAARIVFVGAGFGRGGDEQKARVVDQVARLGLEDRIIFTGFRSDVNNILVDLDVSVQASLSENLGGTIESLLMEVPTVATRTGGMVDSVRDGETGLLVEPLDPTSLAEGVISMLRDPERARAYARAGRALMEAEFALDRTVDKLDELYRCLLERRKRGYRFWIMAKHFAQSLYIFPYLALRMVGDVSSYQRQVNRQYAEAQRAAREAAARQAAEEAAQNAPPHEPAPITPPRNLLAGLGHWLAMRPLYFYGTLRHVLRGTEALRRWDIFFARIRGHQPREQDTSAST